MTPLPKKRHSTRRQGIRRAAINLPLPQLVACSNCHEPTRPHRVCLHCGFYRDKKVK